MSGGTRPAAPWWRADRLQARRPLLIRRNRAKRALQALFDRLDFTEVETPALQISPGMEVHLQAFGTEILDPGRGVRPIYLHTSPEFAMKKLLAGGERRIWQLTHVFRNAERGATHHPEFSMIEWYRAGEGYRVLIDDCVAVLRAVAEACDTRKLTWRGVESDPFADWQVIGVQQAFERHAGIDLLATAPDPGEPDAGLLAEAARGIGVAPHEGDRWDDLFFRIFLERIEPKLGHPVPTVLIDYPISMAALSRPKPDDPRLAERFELYVAGLEIANAFGELTDGAEQRRRFEADQARRREIHGAAHPLDEDFLAAFDADRGGGLPDCAGIALGFDRLVMLATGAAHVEDVLWAPVAAPLEF
ncbi:MAG: EF-P lysine aminoacylase EpmA [Azospirillaceae bacterium]